MDFKEAGLGGFTTVEIELIAGTGTEFTYQCFTRSNNQPQGEPNSTKPSTFSESEEFNVTKSGNVTGDLTLTPQSDQQCQGRGLKLCLIGVTYNNVVLQDNTSGATLNLGGPYTGGTFFNANNEPTRCE